MELNRMRLLSMLAIAAVCGCSAPADSVAPAAVVAPPSLVPSSVEDARARISEGVFDPYTADDYPKLFATLGDGVSRIQAAREGGAFKALSSGRCDRVELAEVSNQRTTASNISVFVDCTNRERFYVNERDLAGGRSPVAQSQRVVERGTAIRECAEAARGEALFPSLVDAHTWAGASFQANKTTGNARVLLEFEATNGLGVELPYLANCLFPAGGGAVELQITTR